MFSISSPPEADLYDGFPMVELQDRPEDLKSVLTSPLRAIVSLDIS